MPNIEVRVIDAYVYRTTSAGLLFLVLKRAKTKMYEHIWQGVAGKIEDGETSWEAATRELKEETGLAPLKIFVADHVSKFYETNGDRINLVPVSSFNSRVAASHDVSPSSILPATPCQICSYILVLARFKIKNSKPADVVRYT